MIRRPLPYNSTMGPIYLDNNATTQPDERVLAAMDEMQRGNWANPSSVHRLGQMARQRVELARAAVAKLIGAHDREIVFTSGGTESNNLALRGALATGGAGTTKNVLITTAVEHSAVREPAAELARQGVQLVNLPVNHDGLVIPENLSTQLAALTAGPTLILVSIQWANNETGAIQDVAALAAAIESQRKITPANRIILHVDATQAVGKIPVNVKAVRADLLTFSAHKFHGPKGVGSLYVRTSTRIKPQQLGGPQERERRGGTENAPAIVGMGAAAELAMQFLGDPDEIARLTGLRDKLEHSICQAIPDAVVNARGASRLWNTTNIGFPRLEAEALLMNFSERGLCVSAGAACSSGSLEPSPVLLAMGIPEPVAHGSLRFSLSRFTTDDEINEAIRIVPEVVRRLKMTLPMGV